MSSANFSQLADTFARSRILQTEAIRATNQAIQTLAARMERMPSSPTDPNLTAQVRTLTELCTLATRAQREAHLHLGASLGRTREIMHTFMAEAPRLLAQAVPASSSSSVDRETHSNPQVPVFDGSSNVDSWRTNFYSMARRTMRTDLHGHAVPYAQQQETSSRLRPVTSRT